VPGQPARARAHFRFPPGNSLSRIAISHWRNRNHRSASVESSNVFDESTLGQNVAHRNRKTLQECEETVDDETSLWKAEENAEGIVPVRIMKRGSCNNLHAVKGDAAHRKLRLTNSPQGLKPRFYWLRTARLNPCPSQDGCRKETSTRIRGTYAARDPSTPQNDSRSRIVLLR